MRALSVIGALVLIVAIIAAFVVVAPAAMQWWRDVNRETTQHSQGYVESKTQLLMGLISDYEDPEATEGQRTAIANEFCYQVTLLLEEERPAPIRRFTAAHC